MGWLIKKHEASLTPFGTYPGARSLEEHIKNGIIILDKPSGPTRAWLWGIRIRLTDGLKKFLG